MTFKRSFLLLFVFGLATSSITQAQLPQTRLYALSRLGGQVGTEFELQITSGDDLEEVSQLAFSHPGITASQKTTESKGQQIPVANTFNVKIAGDVQPGIYEVRCSGLWGVSNPRRFVVGQRAEVLEVEDNNSIEKATPVELNSVVNGRLQAGNDIDFFRIVGTKGQRIILDCWSARLDAKMDAAFTIYDASGKHRLTYSRNTRGTDPTMLFEVPADGEYLVKLHDQTYKNGNEYVYRLEVHTGPYLEVALPAAGKAGTTQKLTLLGYNLPNGKPTDRKLRGHVLEAVEVDVQIPAEDSLQVENRVSAMGSAIDTFSYSLPSPTGDSNPIRIGIASSGVVVENEPNDTSEQAQQLSVPVEVDGLFAAVGDSDLYRFEAKAGQVLYVEVIAERMGFLTDPYLIVQQVTKKEDGTEEIKRLTAQDDVATTLQANVFETKTDDPVYRLQVPADGTYEVTVRDRYWESRGAPNLAYRLSIHEESPDYRLVAIPSSPTAGQTWPVGLRKGDNFPLSVFVFRQDGYEGPIEVSTKDLPAGFSCPSTIIGEKETIGTLVVTTKTDVAEGAYQLAVQWKAVIDNPAAVRAIAEAEKALENARKPIPDLEKAVAAAQDKLQKAETASQEAAKASADKPDDAGLKQKADQLKQEFDKVAAEKAAATAKLEAGNAARQQAEAALVQANKNKTDLAKTVTRNARTGTIVWSTANNDPAITRLTSTLACSVMPEEAPFQILAEVQQVEANQSRQILVPVKLEKRNAFDDKVTLTPQGLPKSANIDLKIDPIEKGKSENTMRVFVKDNAPPGIYTIWLNSQAQVAYQRNPAKAERLNKVHEEQKKKVEEANKVVQAATQKKNEAVNALTQVTQKVQQSQATIQAKQKEIETLKQQQQQATKVSQQETTQLTNAQAQLKTVDQQLQAANTAQDQAQAEFAKAEEAFTLAEQQAKSATEMLANAEKALAEAQKQNAEDEAVKKMIADLEAARNAAKTQLEAVEKQRQTAEQARNTTKQTSDLAKTKQAEVAKQQQAAKQAAEAAAKAQQEATKKMQAADLNVKNAEQALTVEMTALTKLQAEAKTADDLKKQMEQAEQQAQAVAKQVEEDRKVAEKAATDATNAAKAKNVNFNPPSTQIVIEVKAAPLKLTATPDGGGNLKRGEKVQVKVKVTRQNNFSGPVTLSLPEIPGIAGVSADTPEIPADQSEGILTISANGEATEGALANLVIRATADFNGKAAVDIPVTITVNK